MNATAEWLRKSIKERDITTREVAEAIGVSDVTFSRWMHGERMPNEIQLAQLHHYFQQHKPVEYKPCPWCNPDENGKYNAHQFMRADQKSKITIFYNGGQLNLVLQEEGAPTVNVNCDIYFCPMCGRKMRKTPQEIETAETEENA